MENNKLDNQNQESPVKSSARRAAEKFWEDLMNMPYKNDKVGQSFVKVNWKRLPETDKSKGEKK